MVGRDSLQLKLYQRTSLPYGQESGNSSGDLVQGTEKWNPLTFAIYVGNLDLVKHLLAKDIGNHKRVLKLPGIFKT